MVLKPGISTVKRKSDQELKASTATEELKVGPGLLTHFKEYKLTKALCLFEASTS